MDYSIGEKRKAQDMVTVYRLWYKMSGYWYNSYEHNTLSEAEEHANKTMKQEGISSNATHIQIYKKKRGTYGYADRPSHLIDDPEPENADFEDLDDGGNFDDPDEDGDDW